MPAIQDGYSINVSNRFDLNLKDSVDDGQDSDTNEEIDPLDQLRALEEQKQRERELKKKQKSQQSNKKQSTNKKGVQFKENKDSNVPKKDSFDNVKDEKFAKTKREPSGKGNSGDRQLSGDENRRPPRRRNDQRRERGGDADQFGKSYDDNSGHYNRNARGNSEGDGKVDKKDRPARYERFRGGRGGGHRGQGRDGNGYRSNFRSDGRDDRGKREFDRRSGSDRSGVRPTDKRDGAGPRNWGTPGNEIEETTEVNLSSEDIGNWADHVETQQNEEKQNAPSKEGNEDGEQKDSSENPEEEEQAEVEMTLDEWKALQSNAKKQEFNIRKPGEGEDKTKWNNMKLLHESTIKSSDAPVIHDESFRKPVKPQVEVDIRFKDMPTRGGKGGRGARGGRGRGGYRGGSNRYSNGGGSRYGNRANQPPPPPALNEAEFPTLPAA